MNWIQNDNQNVDGVDQHHKAWQSLLPFHWSTFYSIMLHNFDAVLCLMIMLDYTWKHLFGAFQTGYIALRRALWSENNHGRHIEGSFQTEVLKTGHFKGPFGIKDFEGYNWWTLGAPMILCADSLHDDGASMWTRDDDAEGHFKKQLFGPLPLQPFKALTPEGKPFEGIRA